MSLRDPSEVIQHAAHEIFLINVTVER